MAYTIIIMTAIAPNYLFLETYTTWVVNVSLINWCKTIVVITRHTRTNNGSITSWYEVLVRNPMTCRPIILILDAFKSILAIGDTITVCITNTERGPWTIPSSVIYEGFIIDTSATWTLIVRSAKGAISNSSTTGSTSLSKGTVVFNNRNLAKECPSL
jgi:hypothetical protein